MAESYRDLQYKFLTIVFGLQSVQNGWQLLSVKLHVDDGTWSLVIINSLKVYPKTVPMTWWTFPTRWVSVLAKRAHSAGAKFFLMLWGNARAVSSVRWAQGVCWDAIEIANLNGNVWIIHTGTGECRRRRPGESSQWAGETAAIASVSGVNPSIASMRRSIVPLEHLEKLMEREWRTWKGLMVIEVNGRAKAATGASSFG